MEQPRMIHFGGAILQPAGAGRRVARKVVAPLALASGDLASFGLGGAAMIGLCLTAGLPVLAAPLALYGLAALATLGLFAGVGLYPGYRLHHHEHLRRRVIAGVGVAAGAAGCALVMGADPRLAAVLLGCLLLAVFLQPFVRSFLRPHLRRAARWGEPVEIIGEPEHAMILAEYFLQHWEYGVIPVLGAANNPIPVTRTAMVAATDVPGANMLGRLWDRYDTVLVLADMPDLRLTGLPSASFGGQIAMRLGQRRDLSGQSVRRRLIDLGIALPLAFCVLPVIAVAALAIKLLDPGPAFFRQTREGLDGKPIGVFKLRTMYVDAEHRLAALLERDPELRAEWLRHFKLKRDVRIIPLVGRFLRYSSIDELPQLFNVIRGDMSLVGPRPFPIYHLEAMDTEFRRKRRSVSPGLTGLWQVSARGSADVQLQQQLDGFYIDNRSLWLDFYLMMRTLAVLARGSGS